VDVRGDKGFYDRKIVTALEARRAGFVIVARLTKPIKARLGGLRYTEHRGRVETAEFWYQPHRWPQRYRFVVIRRSLAEDPSAQLTLFTVKRHTYQVLVTNLDLQPLNLWRFYNDRAGLELIIRELKGDYPLGRIPTKHFFANEAFCRAYGYTAEEILREKGEALWMKNTLMPLDIIFIDKDWKVVSIQKGAQPCKADPCPLYPSGGPAKYVLEINAGLSDKLNIAPGSIVQF